MVHKRICFNKSVLTLLLHKYLLLYLYFVLTNFNIFKNISARAYNYMKGRTSFIKLIFLSGKTPERSEGIEFHC